MAKKVCQIRVHVGVPLNASVLTSIDKSRNSVEMEMTPAGVFIKHQSGEMVVPYANIHCIILEKEQDAKRG